MCDTLWLAGPDGALFAKNSDRPPTEVQVLAAAAPRPAGGQVATQYLRIPDAGAMATVLSRPQWLWGAEHGVNARRLAVGNERIWTVDDPAGAPPALIGMDLVRLSLERAGSAEEGVEVLAGLLERHGQGGVADAVHGDAYWSSFLLADPADAWVVETSGRTWAARRAGPGGAAISNRVGLRDDWSRASADVAAGADFDRWRDPAQSTGHADRRLAASRAHLAACAAAGGPDPAATVAHLRDHGRGPWGAPGASGPACPPPAEVRADGTGVTLCMHIPGYQATTASMVVELPADADRPVRGWAAPGSPCVSVFVPFRPDRPLPTTLTDPAVWAGFGALRAAAETEPTAVAQVRDRLGPLEAELWAEAAGLGDDPAAWDRFAAEADRRVATALAACRDGLPRGTAR